MSSFTIMDCDNAIGTIVTVPLTSVDEEVPLVKLPNKCCDIPGCHNISQKWCCPSEQCPMCLKLCKSFHCEACINNGNFGHSVVPTKNSTFSQKQIQFKNLVHISNSLKNDYVKKCFKKQFTLKKVNILVLQERIQLLKCIISDENIVLNNKEIQLETLKLKIDDQKSKNDLYGKRVVQLENLTKHQASVLNDKTHQLFSNRLNLKNVIQIRIDQLITNIFPLKEVPPTIIQNKELDVNNSLSYELAEASKMTNAYDQCVVDTCEEWTRQTELVYQIVGLILPANGDYSGHYKWILDKNKYYALHQTFSERNYTCTIIEAISLTSQLVIQLSFILNVSLPKCLNFRDLIRDDLNETKFSKYVSNLNANVLYLCFSQNVDPNLLYPDHILKNLLQLLGTSVSDLGRFEPPDIDYKLCNEFEKKISNQIVLSDGESDSDDVNYCDWEAVPNIKFPEQSTSSVIKTGIMANTVKSIKSIWQEWKK